MGKLKDSYTFGWTDPRGAFGNPPVKGEGMRVDHALEKAIDKHTIWVEFEPEQGEVNEPSESDDT